MIFSLEWLYKSNTHIPEVEVSESHNIVDDTLQQYVPRIVQITFFHINLFPIENKQTRHISRMRDPFPLVFNPITVNNFASLFNCTPVGRTSDSMMAPT